MRTMLNAKHGGQAAAETLYGVQVLGIVARAQDGEVCFYATADGDGVPAIDNAEALESAILSASDRWIPSEQVLAMFDGIDAIACD